MTETVKKTKAAAKPRKTTTTKTKTAPTSADPVAINGHDSSKNHSAVSHDDVARLAHRFWKEGGHKHGHHEEDWFRAERVLRGTAS